MTTLRPGKQTAKENRLVEDQSLPASSEKPTQEQADKGEDDKPLRSRLKKGEDDKTTQEQADKGEDERPLRSRDREASLLQCQVTLHMASRWPCIVVMVVIITRLLYRRLAWLKDGWWRTLYWT